MAWVPKCLIRDLTKEEQMICDVSSDVTEEALIYIRRALKDSGYELVAKAEKDLNYKLFHMLAAGIVKSK